MPENESIVLHQKVAEFVKCVISLANIESRPERALSRQDWIRARNARNTELVEQIAIVILLKNEDELVRRSLARLLMELNREDEAVEHWNRLRDSNASDIEAAFHVAKALVRVGVSTGDAVVRASPHGSPHLHRNIAAVLEEGCRERQEVAPRHISICGVSFCGSTLMDRLLGGLPGVRSIGESHWLIKARYTNSYDFVDFSSEAVPNFVPCSVCGSNCTVLSPEFRRGLAADRTSWYFRIADQLNSRILISADKNPPKLVEQDPLLRFDSLVIFKSPLQAWASKLTKLPSGCGEDYYVKECTEYLTVWTRSYSTFLDEFSPQGKKVYLSFESFTHDPHRVMEKTCAALSLPFDEMAMRTSVPGHAIGGNSGAMRRLRDKKYGIEILPLPDPAIPDTHLQLIDSHSESQEVHARMRSAFSAMIGS